jgi:hypothetical protein
MLADAVELSLVTRTSAPLALGIQALNLREVDRGVVERDAHAAEG